MASGPSAKEAANAAANPQIDSWLCEMDVTSGCSRNKLMNKPLSQVTSLQWWQNHATRALEQELLAQANADADVVVIVLCVDGVHREITVVLRSDAGRRQKFLQLLQ